MCFVNRDYGDVHICMQDFYYCVIFGHYYGKKKFKKHWKSTSVPPVLSLTFVLLDNFVRVFLSIFIRWIFYLSLKDAWESWNPRGEGRLLVSRYAFGTRHWQGNVPCQIWKAKTALEKSHSCAVFHSAETVVGVSHQPLLPLPKELESTPAFS